MKSAIAATFTVVALATVSFIARHQIRTEEAAASPVHRMSANAAAVDCRIPPTIVKRKAQARSCNARCRALATEIQNHDKRERFARSFMYLHTPAQQNKALTPQRLYAQHLVARYLSCGRRG